VAATKINAPLQGWRARLPAVARHLLAILWPALFAVAALSGVFLVAGSLILVFFFGLNNAALFLNSFYITLVSLILTVVLAPFYDQREVEQATISAA
jgi:archaellum biogenesis protein FlaJ (TadC family)